MGGTRFNPVPMLLILVLRRQFKGTDRQHLWARHAAVGCTWSPTNSPLGTWASGPYTSPYPYPWAMATPIRHQDPARGPHCRLPAAGCWRCSALQSGGAGTTIRRDAHCGWAPTTVGLLACHMSHAVACLGVHTQHIVEEWLGMPSGESIKTEYLPPPRGSFSVLVRSVVWCAACPLLRAAGCLLLAVCRESISTRPVPTPLVP